MTQMDLTAQVCTLYLLFFCSPMIRDVSWSAGRGFGNQSFNQFVNLPMDQPIKLHQFN